MSRMSAPTKEAAVPTKGILQESAPTQKATSPTVIDHVLSRLKDLGITKVFGVAGTSPFPLRMPKALGCDDWFTARVSTCGEFDQALKTASEGSRGAYIK
jgi:hypothetical protein